MTLHAEGGTVLIRAPLPATAGAEAAAAQMLDEGLVACANILGQMRSHFIWQGERGEAEEAGVLLTTEAALLESAAARQGNLVC